MSKLPLGRRNSGDTRQWLIDNKFGDEVLETLAHYSGEDLVALQKTECQELLGTKDGTRLYLRLVRERQEGEAAEVKGGSDSESPSTPVTPSAKRPMEPAIPSATGSGSHQRSASAQRVPSPDRSASPARGAGVVSPQRAGSSRNLDASSSASPSAASRVQLNSSGAFPSASPASPKSKLTDEHPKTPPSPHITPVQPTSPPRVPPRQDEKMDKERIEKEKRVALEKQREAEKLAAYEREKARLDAEKKKKAAAGGGETKQRETFTRWQNMLDSVADDDDDDEGGVQAKSLGTVPAPPIIADEDSEDDEEVRHGDRVVEPERKGNVNSSVMGSFGSISDSSVAESDSEAESSGRKMRLISRHTQTAPPSAAPSTPATPAATMTPEQRLQSFKIAELDAMSKGHTFTRWDKSKSKKAESIVLFFDIKKDASKTPSGKSPKDAAKTKEALEEEKRTGEFGYIFWCLPGKREKSDIFCQPIKKLVEVLSGYHAKTWGLPQPYPDDYRYFSIVGHSLSGSGQLLNLEGEPTQVSAWVNGLHQLLEQSDMALVMTERKDRLIVFQNHPINHAPAFLKGTNLEQKVGFLQKFGGTALGGIVRKKWQTRFFQRNGDFLEYYEWDDTQRNPFKLAGKICLSASLMTDVPMSVLGQPFVLGIRPANNKRTYYIQAENDEDRASWKKYFSIGVSTPVFSEESEYTLAGMRAAALASSQSAAEAEKMKAAAASSSSDKDDPRARGNITKQGFLNKLGGKYRKIIWQLRYFQVVGGQLHYFIANKTGGDQYKFVSAGLIPLGGARVGAMGRVQSLGADHVFTLTPSGSRKIYLLEAASETEKEEWIQTLTKVAKEFKDKQTTDKNVIRAGYMMKMGGKKANKKYRERYFTLQSGNDGQGRLLYFKRLGDKIPAGEIVLTAGSIVKTMSIDKVAREHLSEGIKSMIGTAVGAFGGSNGPDGVQETVFTVKPMTENRTYVLCCSDPKCREEWVEAIQKVIRLSAKGDIE